MNDEGVKEREYVKAADLRRVPPLSRFRQVWGCRVATLDVARLGHLCG